MHQRVRIALIIGIVLGTGSCFLISISGMAAGAALLGTLLLCPLITSLLASESQFLLGLVPDFLIMGSVAKSFQLHKILRELNTAGYHMSGPKIICNTTLQDTFIDRNQGFTVCKGKAI